MMRLLMVLVLVSVLELLLEHAVTIQTIIAMMSKSANNFFISISFIFEFMPFCFFGFLV